MSIWRFNGHPAELSRCYDAMIAEVPAANMKLHLCLRAPDGIIMAGTCPSREVFEAFVNGPFRSLLERHGLPQPTIDDYPVHVAFVDSATR
jgi:hypothetical protein